MHLENTIAKQIKEQVDNAKGRYFKTCPNIVKSYDASPLVCSLRKERNPCTDISRKLTRSMSRPNWAERGGYRDHKERMR
jgi:hypothetical protein